MTYLSLHAVTWRSENTQRTSRFKATWPRVVAMTLSRTKKPSSQSARSAESKRLLPQGKSMWINQIYRNIMLCILSHSHVLLFLYNDSHSLGGGIGQIGHTILRAQIQDPNSPWSELKDVNVRSVLFCAPMTTVIIKDGCSDETSKFIEEIDQNSCVVVYQNDVVPRAYGYLSFINDFVDDAIPYIGPYLMDEKRMPSFFIKKGIEKLAKAAEEQVMDTETFQGIVSVLSNYVHPGKICFYKDEFAKPITLVDKGAFDKNSGKKGTFRSVKYEPVKRKDPNPIEGELLCHGAPKIGIIYDEELLH